MLRMKLALAQNAECVYTLWNESFELFDKLSVWLHFHNFPLELHHYFQSSHSPWPQESFPDHSWFLQMYPEWSTCFLAKAQQHSINSSALPPVDIMLPVAIPCTQVPPAVFSVVLFQLSASFFPRLWVGVIKNHHLLKSSFYLEIIKLLK